MSLLTQASLIVTPNGYKEGKLYSVIPSDGSGDLSVTRATTATRVNSAGLVELVPYNLLSYSEDFSNSIWNKTALSISTNSTTAPNGSTTADTITNSSSSGIILQTYSSVNTSQIVTHSVYLKRTNNDWAVLAIARSGATTYGEMYVWFNLSTGVVGGNLPDGSAVILDTEIENVGNGWYRCSVTGYVPNAVAYTAFMLYPDGNNSFTRVTGQSVYAWGSQLNEGSLKDYQKTETRLNIPRLDYSNGTCPSLLVEPQRTNLVYPSSDFSTIWSLLNSATVSTNQSIAPDGTLTADKITTTNSANALFNVNGSGTTAADYTVSLFIKPINNNSVGLGMTNDTTGEAFVLINLQTGAGTTTQQSGWSNASYKWEQYENGWYRISLTATKGASGNARFILKGNASSEYYLWGAQLEAGSYPTSYIPTQAATVTRNADVISKTGISSLIGQTEGTLFVEAIVLAHQDNNTILSVNDGSLSEYMVISGNASGEVNAFILDSGNVSSVISGTYAVGTTLKCALAYKTNDVAYYINGVQIGVDTSVTIPTTSQVNIGSLNFLTAQLQGNIKAAALWKTRLTNTQLAALTSL
jgi:hypothetical protein